MFSITLVAALASGQTEVPNPPLPAPIVQKTARVGRRSVHAVIARLSGSEVSAEVVHSPRLAPPWQLIGREQPAAALTGTFFAWENQQPVAEVVVDGELVSRGRRGSIVAVDWAGRVSIFDARFGQTVDWTPYRFALRGAVRLISGGRVAPNPQAQRFRDRRIWGRAARTGIGLTRNGDDLILAATASPMTLSEFGSALAGLGAVDAISLDGGGSAMLYSAGRMVVRTRRPLSTLFVLHQRPPLSALGPGLR